MKEIEIKNKITLEGCEEYVAGMNSLRETVATFRKEVEQLNDSLERTEQLLKCLR